MKIFRVDTDNISLMADSVTHRNRQPLFLPDGEWVCEIRPAVRIDRLGKEISARFARRYYDCFTAVNFLRPVSDAAGCISDAIDDAVVVGEWQPVDNNRYNISTDQIDLLIEKISHSTTLKHGDLLILPQIIEKYTPQINQTVEIPDLLSFTFK